MNKKKFLYNTSAVIIIFSLNKVLGFFRESLIAAEYGASVSSDAFYFALSITSLLFIVSGAFSNIMKPVIIKIQTDKGMKEGERFFSALSNFIAILLIMTCILLAVFAKQVISVFGYGFSPEKIRLTVILFRIALISSFSVSFSSIYASYFDCRKMFVSSAFDAYFFNIITISFLFLFANSDNIILFAYVYAAGEFFRIIYFNVILHKKGYRHDLRSTGFNDSDVRHTGKMALPLLAGNLSGLFNTLIDRILASTLKIGSISALNYADKLTSIFTSLILSAIMKVVFPSLTEVSLVNEEEYKRKTSQILNFTLFLALPVVAAFIVFARTMVIVIYEHGAFTSNDSKIVSEIVVIYAMAMFFSSLNMTMGKFFYINKQTKIILISGLMGFVLNVTFNLILIKPYQQNGLAIATLISAFARTVFMLYVMYFRNKALDLRYNMISFLKSLFATAVMICGAYGVSILIKGYMFSGYVIHEIIGMMLIAVTGTIIYAVVQYLLKSEEMNYFLPKRFKNLKG